MKGKVFVRAILIFLVVFTSPGALEIYMDIDNLCNYETTIGVGEDFTVRVFMRNNDGFSRQYVTLPLTFYYQYDPFPIEHIDVGGYGSTGSIELLNGFEPGGFWENVELIEFGWDDSLPLGFCYMATAGSEEGWPSSDNFINVMNFHMRINEYLPGDFCIDSTDFGFPYEWTFEEPIPSFGPICWPVDWCSHFPPYFTNCPTTNLILQYWIQMSYDFDAGDIDQDPITYSILSGPGTIDPYSGIWTFTPDISQAGDSFTLVVAATTPYIQPPTGLECYVDIVVASACGDVNGDHDYNIFDIVHLIGFLYLGGEAPYYYYHADVNGSGTLDIFDVTAMISNLYLGGDDLTCRKLRDDFPMTTGMWWQYERFDDIEDVYDTITVSVLNSSTWLYTFSSGVDTQYIDIKADTVSATGVYPDKMNLFPLIVGRTWNGPGDMSLDSVVAMYSFDTPAGHFDDVYMIRGSWNCGDECVASRTEWFKPGVGMIKLYLYAADLLGSIYYDENWVLIDYDITP